MKTATPATARAINDRLALELLLEHGPLTAPQLRDLTGLSRPTVADLVERLRAAGLVESVGESGEDRRGPNARLYRLIAERAHVAGVDLRRTGLDVTVADLVGRTVGTATRRFGTAAAGEDVDLAETLAAAVAQAAGGRALHVVVLGSPGLFRPDTGDLVGENEVPGWRPDLRGELRRLLGTRVLLENEVNLAAIAEHRLGAAAGRDDFVMLWLDEGVGGAVVLGGRLRRGASGGAGEVGRLELAGVPFCDLLDPAAREGLAPEELAARVADGAFAVITVLDPGLVVLGGGVGRAGGEQLAVRVGAHANAKSPTRTEFRPSTVEGNAVLQGAVLTALDLARDAVFG
jgi:predicted NBD/HSP70 family sugar kinase